jgi:hypothetical protein
MMKAAGVRSLMAKYRKKSKLMITLRTLMVVSTKETNPVEEPVAGACSVCASEA